VLVDQVLDDAVRRPRIRRPSRTDALTASKIRLRVDGLLETRERVDANIGAAWSPA
jgi:hypothetical protein